jgi:hypothetical protein
VRCTATVSSEEQTQGALLGGTDLTRGGDFHLSRAVPGHYSGILECPCNSRYGGDPEFYPDAQTKVLARSFTAIPSGSCSGGHNGRVFKTAAQCFEAVAALGFNATSLSNKTESDPTKPAGCVVLQNADGSADALFNTGGAGQCTSSKTKLAGSTSGINQVSVGIKLEETVSAMTVDGEITAPAKGTATITLTGPSDRWFAVGFGAKIMAQRPYTIVVNNTGAEERTLGTCGTEADHCAGTPLAPSVQIVSNSVADGVRTVVLSRALVRGLLGDRRARPPDSLL